MATMFVARVKLQGPIVKFIPAGYAGPITVTDETRKKKLDQLLKLLRKQKLNFNVAYESEKGKMIAVVSA
jgi:hypothetical protein